MAAFDTPAGSARRNSAGLARDLEILDLLAGPEALREDGLRVLRIAELLGRDKAAVSRALATLADAGVVARDPDRLTYHLGPRLYALAAVTGEATLVRQARPMLRRMTHATRETTHLSVLRAGNVLTLASEVSPHEVGTASWAGATTAAWRTPSGRVLVSDWDRGTVESWYAAHGGDAPLVDPSQPAPAGEFAVQFEPPPGRVRVHDLDSFHAELELIRTRGYAVSEAELEHGVVAASAPVRDATGAIVAALNVSAPRSRLGHRLDDLGAFVARCGGVLSAELGQRASGQEW